MNKELENRLESAGLRGKIKELRDMVSGAYVSAEEAEQIETIWCQGYTDDIICNSWDLTFSSDCVDFIKSYYSDLKN